MTAPTTVTDLQSRLFGLVGGLAPLWAQAAPRRAPARDLPPQPSWTLAIVIAVAIFIGVPVVYYLRRDVTGSEETDEDLLAEFERAYFAGEMDEAEFRRVRESLERRGLAPPPPSPAQIRPAAQPAAAAGAEAPPAAGPAQAAADPTPAGEPSPGPDAPALPEGGPAVGGS